ncbi:MAG: ATP-dependent dethiobiotin synthetase BioD [Syntrophus sp. SKADARSKE-3]|nr:ATP-dependent dethiobiotin synthetase BioD [Syntrophus sp. SKADARSKE-3]
MTQGIFIIGTDTEVGKTVVSAGLMYLLRKKHYRAAYFKPIASGEVDPEHGSGSPDASFVKVVSGFDEQERNITPFAFKNAVAPHLASRMEGRPIEPSVIQGAFRELMRRYEWIVAEGAGGIAIPLNDKGYMQYDLIQHLGFSCFLVCRTNLGTINHTLLTVRYAESLGIRVKGLFMSGYGRSELERDNMETIRQLTGINAIFTIPVLAGVDTEKLQVGNLRTVFEEWIDIDEIAALMEVVG